MKFADKINALPHICPICGARLSNSILIISNGNTKNFSYAGLVNTNPDQFHFKRIISFDEYDDDLFIKDGILNIDIPKVSTVECMSNCFGHYYLTIFKYHTPIEEGPTTLDLNSAFIGPIENIYAWGYKIENARVLGQTKVYEGKYGMWRQPLLSLSLYPTNYWFFNNKEQFLDRLNSFLILD